MTNTSDGLPAGILDALRERLPALPWSRARLTHGAFHHVALLASDAVVRVRTGRDHAVRTAAEVEVAGALAEAGLDVAAPLSHPLSGDGWSAAVFTFIAGEAIETGDWAADADTIVPVLERLAATSTPSVQRALPPARAWCGGADWPHIVDELTAGRPVLRDTARAAVDAVLADERGGTLLHGDFGPHNLMRDAAGTVRFIDTDHASWGDSAIDIAPLLGWYPVEELGRSFPADDLRRAIAVKRTLPLQVAAAAELAGDHALRDHALGNFAHRNAP
jgi:aminoglycoside phosphotransferase (APT) family kinase protein